MKSSFLKVYTFFVKFLMDDFSEVEKHCGHYIIKHVIYTCIYLLYDLKNDLDIVNGENTVKIIFDILSKVISKLPSHPVVSEEVCRCLHFLVNSLVNFIVKHQNIPFIMDTAFEMLKRIILEYTCDEVDFYDYTEAVSTLDLLPSNCEFFSILNERLQVLKASTHAPDVLTVRN